MKFQGSQAGEELLRNLWKKKSEMIIWHGEAEETLHGNQLNRDNLTDLKKRSKLKRNCRIISQNNQEEYLGRYNQRKKANKTLLVEARFI